MDFINFKIIDFIDITLVALILLQVYRLIRGTAALTIFTSIFILYLIWLIVDMLNMELLSLILGQVLGVGALALVIVFQQEIRRYLLLIGTRIQQTQNRYLKSIFKFNTNKFSTDENPVHKDIETALINLSQSSTGALIVLERSTDLDIYSSSGDILDAVLSSRLVESIFNKHSPLHDGAMIIKGNRIYSARCILPTSDNLHLPAHMGLRHRAAMGLAEHSDALILIVSEETGRISYALNGEIHPLSISCDISKKIAEILNH